MEKVGQFIYGNEVTLPISDVRIGELFFDDSEDKINVYQKTKKGNILVKTVDTYFELSNIDGINLEPVIKNSIFIHP